MRKLLPVILAFVILCSCAQPRVVDEVNMAQAIGYDMIKDDKVEGMFVIPIFQQDKMGKYQILSGTSSTTSDVQAAVSKKQIKRCYSDRLASFYSVKKSFIKSG